MLIFGVIYCALLWWDCKRSEFKTEAKLFQALTYAFMIYIVYILATIQVEVPHRAQLQYTLINIVITTAFLVYFQTKFVLLYKFIGSGIVLATLNNEYARYFGLRTLKVQ